VKWCVVHGAAGRSVVVLFVEVEVVAVVAQVVLVEVVLVVEVLAVEVALLFRPLHREQQVLELLHQPFRHLVQVLDARGLFRGVGRPVLGFSIGEGLSHRLLARQHAVKGRL
jgi:hypothetical protein